MLLKQRAVTRFNIVFNDVFSSSIAAASHISDVQKEEETLVSGSPPKFVRLPTDLLVAEGEDAFFECAVTGQPKPDLRWYSDDCEVTRKERILVSILYIEKPYNISIVQQVTVTFCKLCRLKKRKMEQEY